MNNLKDEKNSIISLEDLFKDLRRYWLEKVPEIALPGSEESFSDLYLPTESKTRLCYFDISQNLLSFYRNYVFPIFKSKGHLPITATDIISPGDSLIPTIISLIERSSLFVIDLPMLQNQYVFEIDKAIKRKIPVIIIVEENIKIPIRLQNRQEIKIFIRPSVTNPEELPSFLNSLEVHLENSFPFMIQELMYEPIRLLSKEKYKSAIISAFGLLESELRKQQTESKRITTYQLFDLLLKQEIINSQRSYF